MTQAQAQVRARASVPFGFSLNQQSMPAGAYEVSSQGNNVLVVRNLDTKEASLLIASMRVQASANSDTPHAKLVFRKCGDQYFLAQIWDGQSHTGIAFPKSKLEKELLASGNGSQPEVVVIAMK